MIQLEQVTKEYGSVRAVDRVSFRVRPGEVVGFLGPNGAGKSTVLKMISTWLLPTEGRLEVAGFDARTDPLAIRRSIGYLPEHNALYETMRVRRMLEFAARMRRLDRSQRRDRSAWVVERCGLEEVWNKRIHECSKGYRQRLGLALAILHDPRVLLLDEPTHGLDPVQVDQFLGFLRELAPERAILFSSHILSEVAAVSDRMLVIQRGRLLCDETVEQMRRSAGEQGSSLEQAILDLVRSAGDRG